MAARKSSATVSGLTTAKSGSLWWQKASTPSEGSRSRSMVWMAGGAGAGAGRRRAPTVGWKEAIDGSRVYFIIPHSLGSLSAANPYLGTWIKDLSSVESLILVGCRGPLGSCLLPPKIPPLGEPETKWYRTPLFMLLQSRATKSEHRRRVTSYQMNNQGMTKFVTSISLDPWFNRSTVVSIWEVSSIESVAKLMNNCVSQLEGREQGLARLPMPLCGFLSGLKCHRHISSVSLESTGKDVMDDRTYSFDAFSLFPSLSSRQSVNATAFAFTISGAGANFHSNQFRIASTLATLHLPCTSSSNSVIDFKSEMAWKKANVPGSSSNALARSNAGSRS
ncbi:hypothetical protein KCU79_g72, partial [Aureobasidium melanogenum]